MMVADTVEAAPSGAMWDTWAARAARVAMVSMEFRPSRHYETLGRLPATAHHYSKGGSWRSSGDDTAADSGRQ
jgi:hypothetical protein